MEVEYASLTLSSRDLSESGRKSMMLRFDQNRLTQWLPKESTTLSTSVSWSHSFQTSSTHAKNHYRQHKSANKHKYAK